MRLDDFADRLGDRVEGIRVSLEGSDDVAVVDARDPRSGLDALLIATRRGLLVVYPWSTADDVATASMPPGWVAWGDVRASTVQTSPGEGTSADRARFAWRGDRDARGRPPLLHHHASPCGAHRPGGWRPGQARRRRLPR